MVLNDAVVGAAPAARLRAVGISVVAAIGGFLFGFDTAVINGAVSAIQHQFSAGALALGLSVEGCLAMTARCSPSTLLEPRRRPPPPTSLAPAARPIGVHSPGHVAGTDDQAREEFWPAYRDIITRLGPSRGFPVPTRDFYEREVGSRGALYVGSPETVAQKIAANLPLLGASRFDLKHGMPGMSQTSLVSSIELLAPGWCRESVSCSGPGGRLA